MINDGDDIVDRLERAAIVAKSHSPLLSEAADKIKRLRHRIGDLEINSPARAALDEIAAVRNERDAAIEQILKMRAEIGDQLERLRKERDHYMNIAKTARDVLDRRGLS